MLRMILVFSLFASGAWAGGVLLSGYRITALGDGASFQVTARVGDTGPDYFCGAALYAKRYLNAKGSDLLVLTEPEIRVGKERRVTFQVFAERPAFSAPQSYSASSKRVGETRTVTQGRLLCRKPAVRAFGVTKHWF